MRRRTLPNLWVAGALLLAASPVAAEWEPVEVVGLRYPRLVRSARITGTVVVRLTIAADGSVAEAEAVSGHPLLSQAASKNARSWKFSQSKPSDANKPAYLVYRFMVKGHCAAPDDCRENISVDYPNLVNVRSEIPPIQVPETPLALP